MSKVEIDKSFDRQLLVEGNDDKVFFGKLAQHLGKHGQFGIVECGGWTSIGDTLLNLISDTEYFQKLNHIAIVRDADTNTDAFSSVKSSLSHANRETTKLANVRGELFPEHQYPIPREPFTRTVETPYVSALILPSVNEKGTLENYVISALKRFEMWTCVDHYFNCLCKLGLTIDEKRRAKSELGVFISGKVVDPNEATPKDSRRKLLSDIYRLKWWNENDIWKDSAFNEAKEFLTQLLAD